VLATGAVATDDAETDVVVADDDAVDAGADFSLSEHAAVTARTTANAHHLTPTYMNLPGSAPTHASPDLARGL
jgi:hypothetical protein